MSQVEFQDFNSTVLGCLGHSDPWRWN